MLIFRHGRDFKGVQVGWVLRIKSGKQKVVEDKGNGNKLFSYRYIYQLFTQ